MGNACGHNIEINRSTVKESRLSQKLTRVISRCGTNVAARARVLQCGGPGKACQRAAGHSRFPNIILITLDSLRADRVNTTSNGPSLTPNLDALCKESACFAKAIAQAPWTKPSLCSLLTGLYPSVHGANERGAFGAQVTDRTDRTLANPMRPGVITLSEILSQAGYATAAFTGGGFAHAVYQGRGFQHFYDGGHGLHDLFYQACRWLANCPSSPFFVWLHAYDTHRPYHDSLPLGRFVRPHLFNLTNADVEAINSGRLTLTDVQLRKLIHLYDRGVYHADRQMGFILRALRSSGLLEQSILVFTSDHGEALYEHKLCEHSDVIYNEVLRVPLIIRGPNFQPATVNQYVRLIDLMPTLLELIGLPAPAVQGVSLLEAVNEGRDLHLTAFSELEMVGRPHALQATLRGRDYKIIHWMEDDRISRFDLTADAEEQHDLWGQDGSLDEEWRSLLAAQLDQNTARVAKMKIAEPAMEMEQEPEANWEIEQRLRDLGYID
jgi:choline-sulfatase